MLLQILSVSLSLVARSQGLFEKVWQMDTCGPPQIQNTMMNQTKYPGESAFFRCQIDMSKCMVSFIDWYLLRINASEREKIKSARHGDPHTHTIDNVDLDHEGLYTCVVGNGESANWRHRSILIWKVGKFPALAIVTNMSNYISEYSEQLRLI